MEDINIEQLISTLVIAPSNDILREISSFLIGTQNNDLDTIISNFFEPLFSLEHWAWKILSRDCRSWNDDEQEYFDVFHNLASFNERLILSNHILNTKESFLLPASIDIIDGVFEQIKKRTDENDRLLLMVYQWFDNLSLLIYEHTQLTSLHIISYINQRIMSDIIMNDQFKIYLNQLEYPNPLFTTKEIFYIKICPCLLSEYLFSKPGSFPYNGEQILENLAHDYTHIIHIHSDTIASWSKELLSCITHLIGIITACLSWIGPKYEILEMFAIPEKSINDLITSLIKILCYRPLHEQILDQTRNDESMLIDNILGLLNYLKNCQDVMNFFRSENKLMKALLRLDRTNNDRLSLQLYSLQYEILSEDQMKDSNVANNIKEIFFNYLQPAWENPLQKYKNISMKELLDGFLNLSKTNMKHPINGLDELNFLLKISDTYPIVYDILWSLSFDARIQDHLRLNQAFMNKLANGSINEQIQNAINGIRWNLNFNKIKLNTNDNEKIFDIIISYSEEDRLIYKQLHDELVQKPYRVCESFHQKNSNLIDTMVNSVEQSRLVIICMSKSYKQNNYCRAEIEYAYNKKLKIIPIIIENYYQPNGWLSFLIHGLSPIDFTKHDFPNAMQILLDKLDIPHTSVLSTLVIRRQPQYMTNSLSNTRSTDIYQWTQNDVKQWLIDNNLSQMGNVLSGYKGSDLIRLSNISKHSPQTNLELLQEDSLRLTGRNVSLTEVTRLIGLIEEQVQRSVKPTRWNLKLCCQFFSTFGFK
ncbi:unnamed protein product [Rotaria socialis]|uniref:TIR domain-containing protein n=1 Tax=Rotaria socialis TaxID=392032 RepID=A0A819XJI8_9BILA|nr:unnamed protein product [Rotaria socialis]CAF3601280.1 unnamed protein product [Rotaria socialis]CAF4142643.1 unnamed protein product [Rotaria socialis]CAF4229291.1 unnamed protein product [Rotaria socialis]